MNRLRGWGEPPPDRGAPEPRSDPAEGLGAAVPSRLPVLHQALVPGGVDHAGEEFAAQPRDGPNRPLEVAHPAAIWRIRPAVLRSWLERLGGLVGKEDRDPARPTELA